ncbi:MAG: tRNA (N6-threonylcarbamoyladenosine(37)-N6)-methyltransferase TrmO [Candidatus Cryptobacteroides sp.]|nr:tRNA (N6-threonylcarbamoyladenosine(37)-N6)-methyltransferase TrmO [Candidatus Cryptobacteroides sp.]
MTIEAVAHFRSPVEGKFGLPRQSGLASSLRGEIHFTPAYRNPDAVKGLEGFSRIWLIWAFDLNPQSRSLTVRPPRLGGNSRMGVFATRSPFRPNGLGLSCVELLEVDFDCPGAPVLRVAGADLADGTAIIDIKPYLSYADSFPDAMCGFAPEAPQARLEVCLLPDAQGIFDPGQEEALKEILSLDPRPAYHSDAQRIYGIRFEGRDVHFRVEGPRLTVLDAVLPQK